MGDRVPNLDVKILGEDRASAQLEAVRLAAIALSEELPDGPGPWVRDAETGEWVRPEAVWPPEVETR